MTIGIAEIVGRVIVHAQRMLDDGALTIGQCRERFSRESWPTSTRNRLATRTWSRALPR
jgi:hypothetical protein